MTYTADDLDNDRASRIIEIMKRPRRPGSSAEPVFRSLEAIMVDFSLREMFGLILRLLNEDVRVVLRGLDDVRWVLVSTKAALKSDLQQERSKFYAFPAFLDPYDRSEVPASAWLVAADGFKALYRDQVSRGIIPTYDLKAWADFYAKHIPQIDEDLAKMGIHIARGLGGG